MPVKPNFSLREAVAKIADDVDGAVREFRKLDTKTLKVLIDKLKGLLTKEAT